MGLISEPVAYDNKIDPRINLRECGATEEECNFLVQRQPNGSWAGQRVEINAMTSRQFVAFLEAKLTALGARKVIPDAEILEQAYRRAWKRVLVQEEVDMAIERVREAVKDEDISVPSDLTRLVETELYGADGQPTEIAWDQAIWEIVREQRAQLASG